MEQAGTALNLHYIGQFATPREVNLLAQPIVLLLLGVIAIGLNTGGNHENASSGESVPPAQAAAA
jgi:hypothetical protein